MSTNQCDKILMLMKSGQGITPLEALKYCGCMRLGARIYDLKQKGYNISKRMKKVQPDVWVAEYYLERDKKNGRD